MKLRLAQERGMAFIIVHTVKFYDADDRIQLITVNHAHRYKEQRLPAEMPIVEIAKAIEQEARRLRGEVPVLFIGSNKRSRQVRQLLEEGGYPQLVGPERTVVEA